MKFLMLAVLLVAVLSFNLNEARPRDDPTCPHDKEVNCVHDFNVALAKCQEAAKEKGVIPELECLKYFAQMGEDCWECICFFAK